jgi:hypothetical protein
MTHRQLNKLSMLEALTAYMGEHTDIIEAIPGLATTVAEIQTLLGSVNAGSQQQIMMQGGTGDMKRQLKAGLAVQCADVASKLAACAVMHNDQVLLGNCRTSEYKLSHMKDEQLTAMSRAISALGAEHFAAGSAFGLDQAGLDRLEAATGSFVEVMPLPRMAVLEKKLATEKLAKLFGQIDLLLTRSDLLVAVVRLSQPGFYAGYKSVRALVNRAGRGWQLKVTVVDAVDGVAIAKASCEILPENGSNSASPLIRRSAARGSFGVKTLLEGSYRLTVSKAGYQTKSQVFSVTRNEFGRVRVELEKG